MRIKWNSYRAFEEVQTTTTTLEVFLALSTSLNMHTPYGSAVVHTCVPKTYKGMPVAVKIWKQNKSPPRIERVQCGLSMQRDTVQGWK